MRPRAVDRIGFILIGEADTTAQLGALGTGLLCPYGQQVVSAANETAHSKEDFMEKSGYTVTEVNHHIKGILESREELQKIPVTGEISNFKRYSSGHCYFTLKDDKSALRCVMFRYAADKLSFKPENGGKVVAFGSVAVYERDGNYQLIVQAMRPEGVGDLMKAYAELKEKLEKEGLFDDSKKKSLPLLPETIGVVTSPSGAAIHDIITVSRRRNPGARILLYPVQVQGEGAAADIVKGIEFFNQHHLADVLIVGRGGGSIEDLWAFNEEPVVRAVAASDIPVISAVGHETDFTLSDFAADRRAATPSQAAEIAVIDVESYKNGIAQWMDRAKNTVENRISEYMQLMDSLSQDMDHTMKMMIEEKQHQFITAVQKLEALNPLSVLARGYTITTGEGGKPVTAVADTAAGQVITTIVGDGRIESTVLNIVKKEG